MAGLCGDCDACCRILEVKEVSKKFYEPCKFLGKSGDKGCTIYPVRPQACGSYVCLWLDSQRKAGVEKFPPSLRPNISKVILGNPAASIEPNLLFVYPFPDFPDAWRKPPVSEYLKLVLSRGAKVVVVIGEKRIVINGATDVVAIGTEDEFAKIST